MFQISKEIGANNILVGGNLFYAKTGQTHCIAAQFSRIKRNTNERIKITTIKSEKINTNF